ncbi:MAG: hypothetical protein ACRC2O_07025, partial [Chitinophagaceae bacterium]
MKRIKYLQTVFFLLAIAMASIAEANNKHATTGMNPSTDYRVWVNGKEVFVNASPVPAAYASFEINGVADIEIKASRDIKWVDIRPLSLKLKPVFKDSTIRFSISQPSHLSIELNGSIKSPLFLFANPPETNKPAKNNHTVIFFEGG